MPTYEMAPLPLAEVSVIPVMGPVVTAASPGVTSKLTSTRNGESSGRLLWTITVVSYSPAARPAASTVRMWSLEPPGSSVPRAGLTSSQAASVCVAPPVVSPAVMVKDSDSSERLDR